MVQNDPPIIASLALIVNKGPDTLLTACFSCGARAWSSKPFFIGDGRCASSSSAGPATRDRRSVSRLQPDVAPHCGRPTYCPPFAHEGMPLGILEAMASRVCVIASGIGGNRTWSRMVITASSSRRRSTSLADAMREMLAELRTPRPAGTSRV